MEKVDGVGGEEWELLEKSVNLRRISNYDTLGRTKCGEGLCEYSFEFDEHKASIDLKLSKWRANHLGSEIN